MPESSILTPPMIAPAGPAAVAVLLAVLRPEVEEALAGVLNLVGHPLLALRSGGYYPGLWTSPLMGVFGLLALRELWSVTAAPGASRADDSDRPRRKS